MDQMLWDDALLDSPIAADPALSNVLTRQAEALLAARPAALQTWTERVREHLARNLDSGDVTLVSTACQA
jgi:hypothetical protein